MQFKFRKGNIFKIENGVSTQITQEEYETLKGKDNGSPKEKIFEAKEADTDEQELVLDSESGSEEEI